MSPGSVEDERVFSSMKYIKSLLRNRLTVHLSDCMRLYKSHYTLQDFPFAAAIDRWRAKKARYGI